MTMLLFDHALQPSNLGCDPVRVERVSFDRRCYRLIGVTVGHTMSPVLRVGALLAVVGTAGLLAGCAAERAPVTVAGLRQPVFEPAPRAGRFRVAAPGGCVDLLPCLAGLKQAYGVDLSTNLVPSDDPARALDALRHGEVELAILPATSSEAAASGVVLLEDDRHALSPDHVVVAFRKELAWLYGSQLAGDLDLVTEAMTPESFTWLSARRVHRDVGVVASEWLSTLSLPAPAVAKPGAPPLVIGGWGGPELQLVPEAVARFLERRGYPAVELRELPNRAAAVGALADGVINVLPDYSASLLEYLNGGREEASADAASTAARLGAYLDQFGARASAVSPGAAAMVFAVDAGVARASSLRRLSDLQSIAAVMKVPRVGRAAAAAPRRSP
jgi:glycine betaine/choline ABC-type transport system substrate-binding protein